MHHPPGGVGEAAGEQPDVEHVSRVHLLIRGEKVDEQGAQACPVQDKARYRLRGLCLLAVLAWATSTIPVAFSGRAR